MNTDKQENGIQIVRHPGIKDFEPVFEDIPSAGPNWMVIQRRIDGWDALNTLNAHWYKEGFGDHESEFWLGCQKLHEVTTSRRHELYVQIVISDGGTAYARYDDFVVGSEDEGYALRSLGAYSGDAGDALSASVNRRFEHIGSHYAGVFYRTFYWSWWATFEFLLHFPHESGGIWWRIWNGMARRSLKSCKVLIRPFQN
ncbi:fibrinogen C domain-containing protein 1-like isoform X1 [Drosophila biarmipes]|uniref:fibrinogen C domain-containing protein 1-like isoform X1 n=1 Tax=Drosophila biarmipes TaxID=125945 RepID=UPI001CDA7E79|nr:fibrinogen C domain-containing protein 1-like isoform X1 [Drosophila biarmipes]XP_050740923.1 fibrinogen C domain-containing protein 1-like isoform X1 [Drosophila biarmipes]XP_050740924.1 fibrinogen C domain-containing protein 1-like isoform X1 [Drosophila biarmipes]